MLIPRTREIPLIFRRLALFAASVAVLGVATPFAGAATFSGVVVYGDSLSDNGNLYNATKTVLGVGIPSSPPYYMGRYSNGPVAVEQLASKLGVPLYDFAFGGATSGVGNYGDGGTQTSLGAYNLPGLTTELAASAPLLLSSPGLLSSALFVVFGGANDYLVNGSVALGVADIVGIVSTLKSYGAQHILVPGLPDLGLTPDYYGVGSATAFTQQFNFLLQANLPAGATYFDTYGFLNGIEANPSAYGITDLKDPCLDETTLVACANPSQYLFWDGFHPTTTVDTLLANSFAATVAPTPEPSSLLLLGSGVAGLGVLVRRTRQKLLA